MLSLFKFGFDQIVNGTKRIDLRLYEQEYQKIRINDIIEYNCTEVQEKLYCLVRGILVFERFDDMIELFPAKMFGYDNREEIKIRIKRLYSFEEQLSKHVVGFIIMPLQLNELEKEHGDEYVPKERNEALDMQNSIQKDYSKVNLDKSENVWMPISDLSAHSEPENEDEQVTEIICLKMQEGRSNER